MSLALGVDVGGTKIAAGVVDADGQIVAESRRESPAQDVELITDTIVDLVTELAADHPVERVGLSAAGFVDDKRSTVLFAPNLAWRDEPLKDQVATRCGLPVVVENDANAAAWGEFRYGAGYDIDDLILLTVGTGLGGGIVLGGSLVRGAFGVAAEVGHLRVVPDGHHCGCGNRGCWEQYASGSALTREARELAATGTARAAAILERAGGRADDVEGRFVTDAALAGDVAAGELLEEVGRWLGEGIASLTAVLDPAVVAVGGGVAAAGELLLAPARRAFERQLTGRGHRPELEIRSASLGWRAGLVGVADLARQG